MHNTIICLLLCSLSGNVNDISVTGAQALGEGLKHCINIKELKYVCLLLYLMSIACKSLMNTFHSLIYSHCGATDHEGSQLFSQRQLLSITTYEEQVTLNFGDMHVQLH